ncbi:MAG TPA: class I SAM-dependent methyltransferase [Chitinophagaceae bacterium]|jgi:2-polyprenyl-3-methyl-5-hydroxy-6-metoxy-1,4-benzoquinol methylase|nr:class I SAM-dependent methyltransferase [Chitinophagaceae bacterium]
MSYSCKVCHSENVKKRFAKKDLTYYTCGNCGQVFLINTTNPNYDNLLSDFEPAYLSYFNESPADTLNHHQLLNWIKKYVPGKEKSLLDIGSGSGSFVRFLRREGLNAQGVEPSAALFDHFLKQDAFFTQATPEKFAETSKEHLFDIITAIDVIEHAEYPASFLKSLHSLLKVGGYLFISTPDISSLHQRLTGKRWHYYNRYHFSLFSKKTLLALAGRTGFVCREAKYQGRYFTVSYLSKYFRNFLLGKKKANTSASNKCIRLNLFDTRYFVFEKK